MNDVVRFKMDGESYLVSDDNGKYVEYDDYAKLEAEAQALREEVEDAHRDAEQHEIRANQYSAELAALRARVVVVPDRYVLDEDDTKSIYYRGRGFNACLDELAHLNGKVVSEADILAAVQRVRDIWPEAVFPEHGTSKDCQSAAMARVACNALERELRSLLDEGKDHE